jgi:hypothetical protein
MDGDLYDLLLGHEIGHALNTPPEGWHDAMFDDDGRPVSETFKSFLNVLEDARIEKKIKRKYPGIAKSFTSAYKSLHEKNFFGVLGVDIDSLNFIDRINIYTKLGSHVRVNWRNDWERGILTEVAELETWEEVVDLAKRILSYVEEEETEIKTELDLEQLIAQQSLEEVQEQTSEQPLETESQEDLPDQEEPESSAPLFAEDAQGLDDNSADNTQQAEEGSSSDQEQQIAVLIETAEVQSDDVKPPPESVTDRAFRKKESELINENHDVFMFAIPNADLNQILMPNSLVMDDLERFIKEQIQESYSPYANKVTYDMLTKMCVDKFNARNKQYIMHIFKEFDMRKRATDYARTSISRSGELDMNAIYKYKFSTDLFKKVEVVQKGKSHGLIMFVDMSGSMVDILRNTIEQTLVLVSFCKLANIPFDVYAFSNDIYRSPFLINRKNIFNSNKLTEYSLPDSPFHLKHLISSSFNSTNYRRSFNNLAILVNEYSSNKFKNEECGDFQHDWRNGGFGLHGTPYVETLLSSKELIKKFQSKYKLDIVNVIYLTDGDGNTELNMPPNISKTMKERSTFYYLDKKTQIKVRREKNESEQAALTRLIKEVTGCKHLGFYLINKREMIDLLAKIYTSAENGTNGYTTAECKKMYQCAKENNFFVARNIGYDKYFFMGSSNYNIKDIDFEVSPEMVTEEIADIFNKSQVSKRNNRVLVSQFAKELATGL